MGQFYSSECCRFRCNREVKFLYETGKYAQSGDLYKYYKYENFFYEGRINKGFEAHGRGECRYACGCHYIGEWKNGLPNGKGIKHVNGCRHPTTGFPAVFRYEGEFLDGKFHGEGEIIYLGTIYKNTWENGISVGKGMFPGLCLELEKVEYIEGYNKNLVFDGYCKVKYKNGCIYTGNITNNCIQGEGLFEIPSVFNSDLKINKNAISFGLDDDMVLKGRLGNDCDFDVILTMNSDNVKLEGEFYYDNNTTIESTMIIHEDDSIYDGEYKFVDNDPKYEGIEEEKGMYVDGKKEGVFIVKMYPKKTIAYTYEKGILRKIEVLDI